MRKSYDFSKGVRNPYAARFRKPARQLIEVPDAPAAPLTKAQIRRLDAQVTDLRERTRFLLVSRFGSRFALYYNVSEDMYTYNDPAHATLFKRRAAALTIKRLLGPNIEVIRCRVDRSGKLLLRSVRPGRGTVRKVKRGAA